MATITEDYISFETAKLLKEKGFPQSIFRCHYIIDGNSHYKSFENRCGFGDYDIIAPTLAMAMKWLREVYGLHIYTFRLGEKWHYEIQVFKKGYTYSKVGGDSHDEAVEKAIWKCVNELI